MNLLSALSYPPDSDEFEAWLRSQFGSSEDKGGGAIVYRTDRHDGVLIVRYDKDDRIIEATTSENFPKDDFDRIRGELQKDLYGAGRRVVFRLVLFSGNRLTGRFRHKDRFQLLPMPEDAPKAPFMMAPHPFLIEIPVYEIDAAWITSLRRWRAAREISLLLNVLISGGVTTLNSGRHHWVLTSPSSAQCELLQEGYHTLAAGRQSDFTLNADIPEVVHSDASNYYSIRGGGIDRELTLSSEFSELLDTFDSLERRDRDRFLRACFWFQHARSARWDSVSASHVALISAVEAVAPTSDKKQCKECNRPWAADGFSSAIERYLGGSNISKESRTRLYGLRSGIAHGRSLYLSDESFSKFSPRANQQSTDELMMWDLVRLLLRNWLVSHGGQS